MGHPRWELAGREMGRGIYRRRWDGGNWQVGRWEEEFTAGDGTSKMRRWDIQDGNWQAELAGREQQEMGHPRWELAGRETGRGILPQEMGHLRWELAGRETGRGIYRRRWDIQGRRIYHMTWDFQGRNWQVRRQEEEFTVGDVTSKAGMGLPRPELAGWEETCTTGGGNWQARREEEVTAGDGTVGTGR